MLAFLFRTFIIVSASAQFYPQWKKLIAAQSSAGFSPFIPIILIIANTLRCAFYSFEPFDISLFYQSIVLITSLMFLLQLTLELVETPFYFTFSEFITYYLVFFLVVFGMANFFIRTTFAELFGTILGMLALGIEACVCLPQILTNYMRQSTTNVSVILIGTWFFSDISKTIGFIIAEQPFQFIMCGVMQLIGDIVILTQMKVYSSPHMIHKN